MSPHYKRQRPLNFKKRVRFEEITDDVRWGKIAEGIDRCSIGLRFQSKKEIANLSDDLKELLKEYVVLFAINIEEKHLKVSGYEHQIDRRAFRKKGSKKDKKKETDADKPSVCPTCGNPLNNVDWLLSYSFPCLMFDNRYGCGNQSCSPLTTTL